MVLALHFLAHMAAALQLIIIPVMVMLAVILTAVWADSTAGAILFALFIVVAVLVLVRFARRVDQEEGVDTAPEHGPHPDEDVASQQVEASSDSIAMDIVEECGDESFPASDPPGWTLGAN